MRSNVHDGDSEKRLTGRSQGGLGATATSQAASDLPPMDRRACLQSAAAAALGAILTGRLEVAAVEPVAAVAAGSMGAATRPAPSGSDVGSLFPFIQSQAVKGEFPLSFLNPRFHELPSWKKTARGKLLELLHYAPAACAPAAETIERVDCGDHVRELVPCPS